MTTSKRPTTASSTQPNKERGAALVEATLVLPLLLLVCMGLIEIGVAWNNSLKVNQAIRDASRAGSTIASSEFGDRESLRAFVASIDPDLLDQVRVVAIYDAGSDGEPPETCAAGVSTTDCNAYDLDDLANLDQPDMWGCAAGALDATWCPTGRRSLPEAPLDLGVFVELESPWITNFLPGTGVTLRSHTVMQASYFTG